MAEYLFSRGAEASATNKDGWQPLHFVAHAGHLNFASRLATWGAEARANTKTANAVKSKICTWRNVSGVVVSTGEVTDLMEDLKDGRKLFDLIGVLLGDEWLEGKMNKGDRYIQVSDAAMRAAGLVSPSPLHRSHRLLLAPPTSFDSPFRT